MYKILFDNINHDENESKVIFSRGIYTAYPAHKLPEIKYTKIEFCGQPSGQFDFSKEKNSGIIGDVSKSHILFNNHADFITLYCVKGLNGNIDFSYVRQLDMFATDLSCANIKFNRNAQFIALADIKGLRGYFDFSNVQVLDIGDCLYKSDALKNVSGIKFNPKGLVFGISETRKQMLEVAYRNYETSK